jgi:hypothetical protein
MSQGARNGNENGVEWERPAGEVVNLEGVKNPYQRLTQVRSEEMIVAIQGLDEHA